MHSFRKRLKKLDLIGSGTKSLQGKESIHKIKTVYLVNQSSFIIISACLVFATLDVINGFYGTLKFYALLSSIVVAVYLLNRRGFNNASKHILIISCMLTVFIFSLRSQQETYTSLMFFPIVIAAFAVFEYNRSSWGLLYLVLALGLFAVDSYAGIDQFRMPLTDPAVIQTIRFTNFLIGLLITTFLVVFMLRINRQTEEMLKRQNALLQKTNHELDKFVYSTSHDLRAPLMSVLGLVNISRQSENIPEIQSCLQMMETRINTLDNFITEIIDISRNKKSEIMIDKVDFKNLIDVILEEFKFMDEFKKIEFKLNIDEQSEIHTDATRMNLIMRNLISNAIKYHNYYNNHPMISIGLNATNGHYAINVHDNGPGIAPEYQERIFQMFYRASEGASGSGLGLYIVKEAVEKLNGQIDLESRLGEGCNFKVNLPKFETA